MAFLVSLLATIVPVLCAFTQSPDGQVRTPKQQVEVSAPITVEQVGRSGMIAATSVLRVLCQANSTGGSGFLHKSGKIITAAHVVGGCQPKDLVLMTSKGARVGVKAVVVDPAADLALLEPAAAIPGPTLPLSGRSELPVGLQVSTWGFPAGYNGVVPLLTVGYLAGVDRPPTPTGLAAPRWVVNAAFNGGNSGGPVLSSDDGQVIGVVSSKLAPIPPIIESALEALANQKAGFMYTKTAADGSKVEVSEGAVIAEVLKYLRSQTQLVLGHAVTSDQLKAFLLQQKIDP